VERGEICACRWVWRTGACRVCSKAVKGKEWLWVQQSEICRPVRVTTSGAPWHVNSEKSGTAESVIMKIGGWKNAIGVQAL